MADVQSDATDQMPAGPASSALLAKPRLWLAQDWPSQFPFTWPAPPSMFCSVV
jgi:hypothetical protein